MKAHYALAIFVCLIGFVISILSYATYRDFEKHQKRQEIIANNNQLIQSIETHIYNNIHVLNVLEAFYNASDEITRSDFHIFSSALLELNPAIQALEWIPKVLHSEREAYRQKAIEDGFHDYEIIEKSADGGMQVAGKRDVYYPVYYLEPYTGNEIVLGYDPPDHVERREAIQQATATGKPISTPSLTLAQETQSQKGVLIFSPIYQDGIIPKARAERINKLSGLILMVLRIGDTINYVINKLNSPMGITLVDITSPESPDLLFQNHANVTGDMYVSTGIFQVANRIWKISIYPKGHVHLSILSGKSGYILVIGASLSLLMAYIIFELTQRKILVENMVKQRTKEVRDLGRAMESTVEGVSTINLHGKYTYANDAYANLLNHHPNDIIGLDWLESFSPISQEDATQNLKKATQYGKSVFEPACITHNGRTFHARITLIRKLNDQMENIGHFCFMSDITERKTIEQNLKVANEELEEFAYRTSHDLRSPLVSSLGLLTISRNALLDQDYALTNDCLGHIESSLRKLDMLVSDILALTQTKSAEEEDIPIDVDVLIENSLQNFSHLPNYQRLEIKKQLNFDHPLVTKQTRLQLIIDNLISNAIKYQDLSRENPFIKISTQEQNGSFIFEIEDNGLGIPQKSRDKLFKMFQRFHRSESYGSGLGLYMIKKSADIISGAVSVQHPEHGVIFRLEIPLRKGDNV